MTIVPIHCETETCPNFQKKINHAEIDDPDLLEAFMDMYGQGFECEKDYCPECGKLGVLKDPS